MALLEARIREATRWLATLGLLCLFVNALAVVADVALRAMFSAPIDRLSDVSSVVYFIAAACCLPAATAYRRHITIRALDSLLGPRARAAVDTFAAAVSAIILGMIAYQVFAYAGELLRTGRTLSQIAIRVAPLWYFVFACLAAAFLIQVWICLMHAAVALGVGVDTGAADEQASIL